MNPLSFAVFLIAGGARAADLEVFCAVALEPTVKQVAARFEKSSGHRVHLIIAGAGEVAAKAQASPRADVVIVPPAFMAPLEEKGVVRSGTRIPVVSASVGIGIRADSKAPDISTPEAFRAALLAANRIYHTDLKLTPTGRYYAQLTERLGIADQVKGKSEIRTPDVAVLDMVKDTSPDPVLVFISLTVIKATPGARMVGPLPGNLKEKVSWVASLGAHPADSAAAAAFQNSLADADARRIFLDAGFDPAP